HLALEPAGCQGVDPHAPARPLARQFAGEGDEPALAGRVAGERDLAGAHQPEDRHDVDDAASAGLEHRTADELADGEGGREVDVQDLGEALGSLRLGGLWYADTSVVDEDIDAAETVERRRHQPLSILVP